MLALTCKLCAVLELHPNCECCDRDLPPDSVEAMICTFECTFCVTCVERLPGRACPNCGGQFTRRPVRPASLLAKYPASAQRVWNPRGCQDALASR